VLAWLARDVQAAVDVAISSTLIAQKDLFAIPGPDVIRILPSGWRSVTIAVLSDVAKRSRTFFGNVQSENLSGSRFPR